MRIIAHNICTLDSCVFWLAVEKWKFQFEFLCALYVCNDLLFSILLLCIRINRIEEEEAEDEEKNEQRDVETHHCKQNRIQYIV